MARLLRAWPAGPAAWWAPAIDVRAHSQTSLSITLAYTYFQLISPPGSSRAQRAPSAPSAAQLLSHTVAPALFPQSHEGSSEPDTGWVNTKSCVSALPFHVGVHLVTEPLDAFPVFLRDTWVSGLILQREKNRRGRRKAQSQCKQVLRAGSSSDLAAPELFVAETGDPERAGNSCY